MRARGVAADGFPYSTLLAALTRAGHLDHVLTFLPLMEADAVAPDLVLFSNLIHLALRAGDAPKALALFSRLRAAGIRPDLKAYNAAIAAYCKSDLLRDAKRLLLHDVPADGVAPDAESYAPVLAALARRGRHLAAVSLFSHMRAVARVKPDLSVFNIVLCSTRTGSWTSCATPTGSSGPCAGPGCPRASSRTTPCSACTATPGCSGRRSTFSASCAAPPPTAAATASSGPVEGAAKLFEKLRESGTEMDPVLYQTMVVAYERAGLVSQSKRLLRELRDADQAIPKETAMISALLCPWRLL